MSNFAFQVSGAFQGNGQFAFQGSTVTVAVDRGTFNLRPRRKKKKKIEEVVYENEKEYSPLPEAVPEHIETLAKVLAERGIPFTDLLVIYEEDDEEEALIQATKILIQ